MASTASGEICLGKRQRMAKEEANRVFAPKKGKESCSHLTVDRIRSVEAAVLHRSVAWLTASSRCLGLATRTVGKEIWGILLAPSCLPNSFGLRGYSSLLYVDCLRGFGWASADGKESWRILLAPLCSPNSFGLRGCSSALCVLACHGCAWLVGLGWARGLATRTVGKEIWGILLAPSCLPNSFGLRGYSSLLYVDCLRGFGWASADGKESWRILLAPLCSPNSFGLRGCSSALCVLACHGCAWLVGLGWASSTKGKEKWGILLASLCSPICSVYAAVVLFSVSSILEVLSWGWVFWAGRQALAKKVEESCSHLHVRRFRFGLRGCSPSWGFVMWARRQVRAARKSGRKERQTIRRLFPFGLSFVR